MTLLAIATGAVIVAQTTQPGDAFALIREYGAIAVLAAVVFFWLRGKLFNEKAIEEIKAAYEERLSEQQAQYEARLIELRKDRDEWKGFALDGVRLAERSVQITDKVTSG